MLEMRYKDDKDSKGDAVGVPFVVAFGWYLPCCLPILPGEVQADCRREEILQWMKV
jgi:hypothetical protein